MAKPPSRKQHFVIQRGFVLDDECRGDLVYVTPEVCAETYTHGQHAEYGDIQGVIIDPESQTITHGIIYNGARDDYFERDEEAYELAHEVTLNGARYLIIPAGEDHSRTVGEIIKAKVHDDTSPKDCEEIELLKIIFKPLADKPHSELVNALMMYRLERFKQDPKQIFPSAGASGESEQQSR